MPSKKVEKLTPEVVDLVNRLSKSERTELARHEKTIDKALPAFAEIGDALNAIRESKLYRENYSTFDAYLSDRWSFTRQRASQLIDAAETMRQLPAAVKPAVTSERAARAMKPLADKPAKAKRAVKDATKNATGDTPTGADLERAVKGVVGDGPEAAPHAATAPSPTGVDVAREWLRLTDSLNLAVLSEPARRKMRATAAGLVAALDVSLNEAQKTRHVAAAKKRTPTSRRTDQVTPRLKGVKS